MIYLFYGEEKYELYKQVEKIKKEFNSLEVGVNLFNITKDNINELEPLYESVNFFGSNKLVLIKDTSLKFNVKKMIENSFSEDIYVIIEDSIDKRISEYKELSKVANIKEFKYLNESEMANYLISVLKNYNVTMSKEVADYMTDICGIDKSNNINELQKIVAFLGENSKVTKEVIDKICSKTLNSKIFDMLDMAINKKHDIAIIMLDELIKQKEPAIKISIMLYKQIKQMYLIKVLKAEGEKDPNTVLKIHPFAYSKILKASSNYSMHELRKLIDDFDKYDQCIKIGKMDFDIGLKKIICSM